MSKLLDAVQRLDGLISELETAVDDMSAAGDATQVTPDGAAIRSERDELAGEVQVLRRRAKEDAQLRAEAAEAVREALRDLRGAVDQEVPSHA
ncbi:MAG: hypothetical protein AAF293_01315 [Pseudomonadota bacterium]